MLTKKLSFLSVFCLSFFYCVKHTVACVATVNQTLFVEKTAITLKYCPRRWMSKMTEHLQTAFSRRRISVISRTLLRKSAYPATTLESSAAGVQSMRDEHVEWRKTNPPHSCEVYQRIVRNDEILFTVRLFRNDDTLRMKFFLRRAQAQMTQDYDFTILIRSSGKTLYYLLYLLSAMKLDVLPKPVCVIVRNDSTLYCLLSLETTIT